MSSDALVRPPKCAPGSPLLSLGPSLACCIPSRRPTLWLSTPRLHFSVPCRQKEKKVSNLGKRAEKFSCLPSPQEDVAAAEATTEAHATMSDYDTAAADDEAGSDIDGTRSSEEEDEDDNYKDGDDYEDEPDGGGSKITSWVQRVYEAGSTLEKYMLSLLGITPFPRPTPTPHARLLPLPRAVSDWSSSSATDDEKVRCPRRLSGTRRACNKSSSSEASSRRLPS